VLTFPRYHSAEMFEGFQGTHFDFSLSSLIVHQGPDAKNYHNAMAKYGHWSIFTLVKTIYSTKPTQNYTYRILSKDLTRKLLGIRYS